MRGDVQWLAESQTHSSSRPRSSPSRRPVPRSTVRPMRANGSSRRALASVRSRSASGASANGLSRRGRRWGRASARAACRPSPTMSRNAFTHHHPATPADASVALAKRGHGPGDRAGHLPAAVATSGYLRACASRPGQAAAAPRRPTPPHRAFGEVLKIAARPVPGRAVGPCLGVLLHHGAEVRQRRLDVLGGAAAHRVVQLDDRGPR